MGFTLDSIVPWGRSFDEYVAMFGLSAHDLGKRILGCGDGPASFNASLTKRGGRVVSVDPIYEFSVAQISSRIDETYEKVMTQLRGNVADYVWTQFPSPEDVGKTRMAAMREFLSDFEAGKRAGRYVAGSVETLPFAEGSFDLALSSHFLFLYSDQLAADFHLKAILEMLRVANEVRIFPILTMDGRRSLHYGPMIAVLLDRGYDARLVKVDYEFQKGGNEVLVVRRM
jgi:SAM-dependent methyltransferase